MPASDVSRPDGSLDWSSGVNSVVTPTVQSQANPNGLPRTGLAWLLNGTCRDGGISPRGGWLFRKVLHGNDGLFQGAFMYSPTAANPYLIVCISGQILKVDCETYAITNLSALFGLTMPATLDYFFFVQAEEFLVIQAGDGTTLSLFFDGTTMRRSIGITNPAVAPGTPGINELPAATAMDYFLGRIWYVQNRTVSAGDIVGGASGTAAYNFRDAILNVTESPLVLGGDGITLASQDGNVIRALAHSASIDAALGQGRLFAGTRKAIHAINCPVNRTDWIATDANTQPLVTIVQLTNGFSNDRSILSINGDLFFRSLEPGVRSLQQSVRNFSQWANPELSANINRVMQFEDRALIRFSSGVFFDNLAIHTALPRSTPQGVVFDQCVAFDIMPISTFNATGQPHWNGSWESMPTMQMNVGDFGGLERAFAIVRSELTHEIQLWEILQANPSNRFDLAEDSTEGNRIVFQVEFPAFDWSESIGALELKKLVSAELSWDRMFGTVNATLEYRPDFSTCWLHWHSWTECSPQNTAETARLPVGYPLPDAGPCYRQTMVMPLPDSACAPCATGRPSNIAYQIQCRLTIRGYVRLRAFYLWGQKVEIGLYQGLVC